MKKILSLLIAGLLLTSLVACNDKTTTNDAEKNDETVVKDYIEDAAKTGKFEYELNDEGDYEITKYEPTTVAQVDLVLPHEANGRDIVGIADGVFKSSTTIKSVTIPATYEYIGDAAFADCDLLTAVILPESITSIGASVFNGCDSLKTITLSSKITEIPEFAFNNCKALTAINLANVKSIQRGAFANCSELVSVIVSNKIEYATKTAFAGCSKLVYNKDGGLCYLGDATNKNVLLVQPESLTVTNCTVNANTKVVADSAFLNCKDLKTINLSPSIKVINGTAFENCSELKYNVIENGCYLGNEANPCMVLIKLEMPNVEDFTLDAATKIITATAFAEAINLEDIGYDATQAYWNAIIKAAEWNHKLALNITCTDGLIELNSDGLVEVDN